VKNKYDYLFESLAGVGGGAWSRHSMMEWFRLSIGHEVPEGMLEIMCEKAMGAGAAEISKEKFRQLCDKVGAEQKLTAHY
jgi:hypothetical protein